MNVADDRSQLAKLAGSESYGAPVAHTNRGAYGNSCTRERLIHIKHLYVQLANKNFGKHVHAGMVVQRDARARGENNERDRECGVIQYVDKLYGQWACGVALQRLESARQPEVGEPNALYGGSKLV
jgi:hypothetical protein